ncbi:hypothetical protein GWI33_011308 [Rhynchophorus ferrugineus]|uniref:Uncharacterized protein n=1 Tax=Rhynchophorus ferrugineus TaxID=354439 RepID=A0A834I772_RHYFE|nr:hypothetical protein GWI33_011308 [Rhynchophorus ferrugineus]
MIDFAFDEDTSFAIVTVPSMAASYGKKNGIWYAAPGGQGWSKATSRKASIVETDAPPPGGGTIKPSSGRVIRIINNMDHTVQVTF